MDDYYKYRYVTKDSHYTKDTTTSGLLLRAGMLMGLTAINSALSNRPRTYYIRGHNGRHYRRYR